MQLERRASLLNLLKCARGMRFGRHWKLFAPLRMRMTFFTYVSSQTGASKHFWSYGARLGPMASKAATSPPYLRSPGNLKIAASYCELPLLRKFGANYCKLPRRIYQSAYHKAPILVEAWDGQPRFSLIIAMVREVSCCACWATAAGARSSSRAIFRSAPNVGFARVVCVRQTPCLWQTLCPCPHPSHL